MTKIVLSAPDVSALLSKHADLELEIATKATDQIATTLLRKITKAAVEAQVDRNLAQIVLERTTRQQGGVKLSPEFSAIMHTQAKECVKEAFESQLGQTARTIIRDEVRSLMPSLVQELAQDVKKDLRQLMKDELVQILLVGGK